MTIPAFHSCSWSDTETAPNGRVAEAEAAQAGPHGLIGEELYIWATYPERNKRKTNKKPVRKRKPPRKKLWAVFMIESLEANDEYSVEVTLKKILKREEAVIRIWVRNDPNDQSDEASVFRILSPSASQLGPLEHRCIHLIARKVYDAIAASWKDSLAN